MKTDKLLNRVDRVKELMKEQGLDIKNDLLFAKIMIIYLKAQVDQVKELKDK